MSTREQDITLVLGGTGKVGRRVAERLRARDVAVRVASRSTTPTFAWEDERTWDAALDGVSAAYLAYAPDLAVPGAAETVGAFARRAAAAGTRRLVLLSGRGEPEAQHAETVVQGAGAAWTVVRASWFAQNFSESFLLGPILDGHVVLPVDGVPEPFVDADDVAEVAVAALTEDGHEGRVHEVTGPRALTFAEAIAEIGAASGRELTYTPVSVAAYAAELARLGEPEEIVGMMTYLFGEVLDGRNASPTDGVRRALGRPARDFRDYARAAADAGTWATDAAAR